MTRFRTTPLVIAVLLAHSGAGFSQGTDPIGLNALRALDPSLTGSGVVVVQAEAIYTGTDGFEVNPAATGQSVSQFIYIGGSGGVATGFPNSVGSESEHADWVGDIFYGELGTTNGSGVLPVASGVSKIYNYEADYFISNIVATGTPISARIVNQSFVDTNLAGEATLDQEYDDYAARFNTLFISGIGNGGPVYSPGTAYNGIGVAAYGGASSVGPTSGGRSKPDITAPASFTSFSTPQVSGAAAILLQAAQRGDAGSGTASNASDARVLKALLLNGAVKPSDWTHTDSAPLDPRYGAGILNIDNSYLNLQAGEYARSAVTSGSVSSIDSGSVVPDQGWAFASIATAQFSGTYIAESDHYLFDLTSATAPEFTLTSTLVWNRQYGQTDINNLDLYLFDATTGATIALSDSTVDNVEQLYVQDLSPGDYDLVVLKNGGTSVSGSGTVVSASEAYALAFNFAPVPEPSVCWLALPGLALVLTGGARRKLRSAGRGVA